MDLLNGFFELFLISILAIGILVHIVYDAVALKQIIQGKENVHWEWVEYDFSLLNNVFFLACNIIFIVFFDMGLLIDTLIAVLSFRHALMPIIWQAFFRNKKISLKA